MRSDARCLLWNSFITDSYAELTCLILFAATVYSRFKASCSAKESTSWARVAEAPASSVAGRARQGKAASICL